eukprot:6173684-Pleurochrysis_carterae.AAC.1
MKSLDDSASRRRSHLRKDRREGDDPDCAPAVLKCAGSRPLFYSNASADTLPPGTTRHPTQ